MHEIVIDDTKLLGIWSLRYYLTIREDQVPCHKPFHRVQGSIPALYDDECSKVGVAYMRLGRCFYTVLPALP